MVAEAVSVPPNPVLCVDQNGCGGMATGPENLAHTLSTANIVVPGLLIGGLACEKNEALLRSAGVTHIVQVANEATPTHNGKFKYHTIIIADTEGADIITPMADAVKFIDEGIESGGVVLVHCMMGVSRSASTCIAYLMWKHRATFVEAAAQVMAARPIISPNPGFVLQLRAWEKSGMDFAAWKGWSRTRFLEALEECGGINFCLFESVMARQAVINGGTLPVGPAAGQPAIVVPPPSAPARRPMPVKLIHRLDCVIS